MRISKGIFGPFHMEEFGEIGSVNLLTISDIFYRLKIINFMII